MSRLHPLLKALPLCCGLLFVAAAEDDCTIRILTDDDGDGCEDTQEVCNLDCELATNDDGCPICECADEEPPPSSCEQDSDCQDGQICEFLEACPPCVNDPDNACEVACTFEGRCVDVRPDPCANVLCSPDTFCVVDDNGEAFCQGFEGGCTFDDECGEGSFCDFSTCGQAGGSGNDRPGAPDDGDQDIACLGVCKELEQPFGCENVLCSEGTICIEGFNGPECVPVESECNVDEDCQGGRCEILCLPDPNCPECDSCLIVGQCVNDGGDCAALCGPGQQCAINDDGTVTCEDVRPPECTSDEQCDTGNCNAGEDVCEQNPACADPNGGGSGDLVACTDECWGYCVDPVPTACASDADCAQGEICEATASCPDCVNGDPACGAPCFLEQKCVPAP